MRLLLLTDSRHGFIPSSLYRVAVISKRFEGKTEHTERWYGSGYNFKKIDSKLIEQWGSVETIEDLHLPPVNEFIPTDFEIVPLEENSPSVPTLIQVCLSIWWLCNKHTLNLPIPPSPSLSLPPSPSLLASFPSLGTRLSFPLFG